MFYSHQLLARKAPLGQIWMAATTHAKINRRKLGKLNIIKICEEILNPSVPMALRLSGILMGGVVIVYERKVKLFYDDVTRLLVEINEAWKVKAIPDHTLLPKGKSQAKYEAVTLPENEEMEVRDIEQSLQFSDTTNTSRFHANFTMQLDDVDEAYININPGGEVLSQHHHQADAENITLLEPFDSHRADNDTYNRFERFDIEGDDDTQLNFTPREASQVPTILVPSPPPQEEAEQGPPAAANGMPDHHMEPQDFVCKEEAGQPQQHNNRQGPTKQNAKRKQPPPFFMDYEQTIIPGQVYQSWIQDPSDLISRRRRKLQHGDPISTMKAANLMELPPVALITASSEGSREVHYPEDLLKQWMRCTQFLPSHDSQSGRSSPPQPPEASISSLPDRFIHQDPLGFPEDFHSGIGSPPCGRSIEKQVAEVPPKFLVEELSANLRKSGELNEANQMVTPRNSGDGIRSVPSPVSGNGSPSHNLEVHSGRSNKKRPYSSSRHSGSSLEPVDEENPWRQQKPEFQLARLSESGPTAEQELLVETGPTPNQHPKVISPIDKTTETIRAHLKTHFETPGAPQMESINQLAFGANRHKAAQLFYHTCVLASHDLLRVEQKVAYGDILISKGAKM